MVAVKMPMPQKCELCRFNTGGMCMATKDRRDIYFDSKRQSWCPLKRVETLLSEQIVDDSMIEHVPEELMEREIRGGLKRGLMRAVDEVPGAMPILSDYSFETGTRFRAVMQVVIVDEL